jgi:hypothetical protein
MAFAPTPTKVNCPNCGRAFGAQVFHLVDGESQPELKEALLAGELNLFQCPACGAVGALQVPLIYHDSSKELLLAFVPMGLNLPAAQEEQFIAQATKALIEQTPPDQRKGYLLRPPTRAISQQGLIETILEADGISRDDIRKQTERIRLIGQLADLVGDEAKLKAAIEQDPALIDRQLLMLVGATIQAAASRHDEANLERYTTLREKLIEYGKLDPKDVPSLGIEGAYEQLVEHFRALPADRLQGAVAGNRPYIDYGFFMHLTQLIDAAQGSEKQELEQLRGELVRLTDEMDTQAKAAMERASGQLNDILRSPDVEDAIRSRLDELDEAFLVVLQANLEAAQQQGRQDIVQYLTHVYQITVVLLQEKLRPELRLINEMLQQESAAARQPLIEEALGTYNPVGFLEVVQTLADDAETQGLPQETLARLRQVEDEVQAAVQAKSGAAPKPKSSAIWTPDSEQRQSGGDTPSIIVPGRW